MGVKSFPFTLMEIVIVRMLRLSSFICPLQVGYKLAFNYLKAKR